MSNKSDGNSKKARTFKLTAKAIDVLNQLHKASGMNNSEIVNKLIIDYKDSIQKKICP